MVVDNAFSSVFLNHPYAFLHVPGVKGIKTLRLNVVEKAGWLRRENLA